MAVRKKKIIIPIYGAKLTIIVGENIKEVADYLNYEMPSTTTALSGAQGGNIDIGLSEDCTLKEIVHECLHATLEVFDFVGAKPNLEDHEPLCYLHDYICSQVFKFLGITKPTTNV